jgi:hypothetical protein
MAITYLSPFPVQSTQTTDLFQRPNLLASFKQLEHMSVTIERRVIIEIAYAQSIQGAIYSVVRDDKMPHSSACPPAAMTAIRQRASASDRP